MCLQGFEETDKWFDVALRVAREFLKMHIISSDSDKIAVVFYGTVNFQSAALHLHASLCMPYCSLNASLLMVLCMAEGDGECEQL